jgi:hypothetical protein
VRRRQNLPLDPIHAAAAVFVAMVELLISEQPGMALMRA